MNTRYRLYAGYIILAIFALTALMLALEPCMLWRDRLLYQSTSTELLNADGFLFLQNTPDFDMACIHGHNYSSELCLHGKKNDLTVARNIRYRSFGGSSDFAVSSLVQDAGSNTLHALFYQSAHTLIHGSAVIDSAGINLHTQQFYRHPAWDEIVAQKPKTLEGYAVSFSVSRTQTTPVIIKHRDKEISISVSFAASDQIERYNPITAENPLAIHRKIQAELHDLLGISIETSDIIELIHYSRFLEYYSDEATESYTDSVKRFMQARILGLLDANEDGVADLLICIDAKPFICSTVLCLSGADNEIIWQHNLNGVLKSEYLIRDIDDDGKEELLLSMYSSNYAASYDYRKNMPLGFADRSYIIAFDHAGRQLSLLKDDDCIIGSPGFNQYKMVWVKGSNAILLGTNTMFDRNPKHMLRYLPSTRNVDTLDVQFTNIVALQKRPGAPVELFDMTTHQLNRITLNDQFQEIKRDTIELPKRISSILPEMITIAGRQYYVTTGSLQLINSAFNSIHDLQFHQIGSAVIEKGNLYFIAQDFGQNVLYMITFAPNHQINPNFIVLVLIELLIALILLLLVQHIRMPLSTGNGSYFILYRVFGFIYFWRLRGRLQSYYHFPKHLALDKSVPFKMFDDIASDYSQIYSSNLILFKYDVFEVQTSDEMVIFQRISHDAKNQVMLLKLLADGFELDTKNIDDPALQEFMTEVRSTIDVLSNAMVTLSKFSHINRLFLESVSIHEVISQAMVRFASLPQFDNFEYLSENHDYCVSADKSLLEIAFRNIISNAFGAINETQKITLKITAKHTRCNIIISNPCKSIEINEDQLYTIGYSTKADGSGLGIPIAKAIIEKHDGSFDISCSDDMFVVTIALPIFETGRKPFAQNTCLTFGF